MNFSLEKSEDHSNSHLSKFRIKDARGDVVGHVSVSPDQEADLRRHWLGSAPAYRATAPRAPEPRATPAAKPNSAAAALVAAVKRHGVPRAATADKENPMIAALVAAAPRNRLSKQAVLRGC